MTEIKGTVVKKFFANDTWASFLVESKSKTYHCSGPAFNLRRGMAVEIEAEESVHPKYGLQYKVVSFKEKIADGTKGVKAYLASGIIKGIGPATADKIVNHFKSDTIHIIEEHPERLAEIPSITIRKARDIAKGYEDYKQYEKIYQITNGAITLNEVEKILRQYKSSALKVLRENPYRLCEDIDGIGFLKADRIAKACGVKEDSELRVKAALKFALEQVGETQGHCYLTDEDLQLETIKILNRVPEELARIRGLEKKLYASIEKWDDVKRAIFEKYVMSKDQISQLEEWKAKTDHFINLMANAILTAVKNEELILDEINNTTYVSSAKLYGAECNVAYVAKKMLKTRPLCQKTSQADIGNFIQKYESDTGFILAPEQKEAVIVSLTSRISVITGGPGRGKTTIIKVIIAYWKHKIGKETMLLAPTGRASQRIRESIGDSDADVATIHKMIGNIFMLPLKEATGKTLILCDESSMIDILLASRLMTYSQDSTLIFVGDVDQLPAVGPGNFFKDLIMSGSVPTTKLITCYRNAGLIAENSDKINAKNAKIETGDNFEMIYSDRESIPKAICDRYMALIQNGIQPKDISVLTLQRVRGCASVSVLNELIREAYNPLQSANDEIGKYRLNDRVMQMHNNYKLEYTTKDGVEEIGVFNGDVGTITKIDRFEERVWITFDDGRVAAYSALEMMDTTLAYATTVHKAQGSECENVIFTVAMDQYTLLYKNIIYTAVSRATQKCIGIVEKKAFYMAVRQDDKSQRNTRLCQFLSI